MSDSVWHVTVAGQAQGPFTLEEVVARLGHDLGPDTLVWNPGLSGWLPVSGVPELAARLGAPRPAAPPAPPAPAPARPVAPRPAAGTGPAANPYSPPRKAAGPRTPMASGAQEEPTLNPFKLIGRAFRWRGKFNRGEFAMVWFGVAFLNVLLLCLAFAVLVFGGQAVGGVRGAAIGALIFWIIVAIDCLAAVFVNLGTLVRRLNDLGKPGWWILGACFPLLNLVLILYLLFAPGDPNAEIPDSFTGVWLALAGVFVMSLFIGGIGAALAIPALLRAKMSANEASARGNVRTVTSAQAFYSSSNGGAYESRWECLHEPAQCIPGYTGPAPLDASVGSAPHAGYVLTLHGGKPMSSASSSPSSVSSYVVIAAPTQTGQTGTRLFCEDQNGTLCAATGVSPDELLKTENGDVSCSSVCQPVF